MLSPQSCMILLQLQLRIIAQASVLVVVVLGKENKN